MLNRTAVSIFVTLISRIVFAEICNPDQQFCANDHHHSSSSSSSRAYPSTSSKLNFNPSTVPTSRGLGFEFIFFKGVDLVLVTGTGRAGAALSPSNNEETFFGAPSFETNSDFLTRNENQTKFPTQKYTLATAFNLYNNEAEGLEHTAFNVGVMAKYNTISGSVLPGLGASGIIGPLSFSYAYFLDETNINMNSYFPGITDKVHYHVQTYSLGLTLGTLSLDYSVLNLAIDDSTLQPNLSIQTVDVYPATVSVATASLFYQRGIFTFAARQENSARPAYDHQTQMLTSQSIKNELFGSAQFITSKYLFLGVFYNYYLLREFAGEVTLFF